MKNKKLLAAILAFIMSVSVSGCTKEVKDKTEVPSGKVVDTLYTDDGTEIIILEKEKSQVKIGNRTYTVDEDNVSYKVVEGDTIWSICRDLRITVDDVTKYNEINPELIYPGDKIKIPMKVFKDVDRKIGVEISDENGNVDWSVLRYFTDFAMLYTADFNNHLFDHNHIDSEYQENANKCIENDVKYGVLVNGDLSGREFPVAELVGKQDAKTVLEQISLNTVNYPVILSIENVSNIGEYTDTYYQTIKDNNELEKIEACAKYCVSFMKEIQKAGYYPMISIDLEMYNRLISECSELKEFDKITYTREFNDKNYTSMLVDNNNCNMNKEDNFRFPLGAEKNSIFSYTWIDNSENGMDELVNKKKKRNIKPVLITGGSIIILGSLSFIGLSSFGLKVESEINEVPYTKKRKKK